MKRFAIALLATTLAAMTGCRRGGPDHGTGEGHEHKEKTAQVTVWTDLYEVFAEHTPPVVNKPTRFITHVTDLKTAEPRTGGMVKFVFRDGETMFEHPQAVPERPGIYIPAITFPKTGDWQATVLIPDNGTNAAVELGTIKVYADDDSAAHAAFPDPPEGISFLKEQQWKLLMRTESVATKGLVERLQVPAMVVPKPGLLAHVTPPLAGQVYPLSENRFALDGEAVKAQQTVALLQPAFSEATAALGEVEKEIARARLAMTQAQRDYQRARELFEAKVETAQNVEQAGLRSETAQAELEAALATRSSYRQGTNVAGTLPRIELKSPIDGVIVSQSGAAVGQHVPADKPLFTVLDPTTVFVEARVPEAMGHAVRGASNAIVELPAQRGKFLDLTGGLGGRLIFTSPEVNAATRTVKLHYEVPNVSGRFRVGQMLTLYVESGRAENAVAIPDSAIVDEAGVPVAFVQVSGETFQKRELTLGIRDGNLVEVRRGVNEGERVATHGAMAIRAASVSGVIPAHGHAH